MEEAMGLHPIRAVYFDAVGTLLHPEPPAAEVYADVAGRYGSGLSLPTIARRFTEAFRREEAVDRAHGLRTSEAREVLRWRQIVAAVLDDVADAEAGFADLYRHFGRPEAWRCDPQAAPLLQHLAAQGYLLGMASNFDQRLWSVVAGKPELHLLARVVISSEVGWRKPAPEFFAALCRSAGVSAPEALYVGDDPANDYHAAEAFGLRGVLLDREGRQGTAGMVRIKQLADLDPGGGPV
jgi:putative hydrolase of the HAD superfamily